MAPCSSLLCNAGIESTTVCKARWRKICQGVVHIAQVWKNRASCTNWRHWVWSEGCWPLLQQKEVQNASLSIKPSLSLWGN